MLVDDNRRRGGGEVERNGDEERRRTEERARRRIEGKEERLRREREKEEEERGRKAKGERRRRERSIVWRGIEGEDKEERRAFVEGIMKRALGKMAATRRAEERIGEARRWIVEMANEEDKEEVLERGGEIRRKWGMGVGENLTMEERKMRWKIMEAAKRERARRRRVMVTNRELWVEGRRWY